MEAKKLYEAIRGGEYNCMPNVLRELFILVGNYQNQPTLTVCRYARPTLIEYAIYRFRLQGITVELINNKKRAESIFTHFFKIKIDIPVFLSNLSIFYKTSEEQLQVRYGNPREAWEAAMKKMQGTQRNNKTNDQDTKNKENILFTTKEDEEP